MHQSDITSTQLVNLTDLFGSGVFSIGSTNSNLVVDNDASIIRISTVAEIDETTGNVTVQEGNSITLSANKFLLTGDNVQNTILPSNATSINDLEEGKYYWGATLLENSQSNHSSITTWTNFPPYISLNVNQYGRVIFSANIGDGNDYYMYVAVLYKDPINGLQKDIMRIDIIASTYPTGYQFQVTDRTSSNNELARRFLSSLAIEDDIFTSTFSRWMGEQVPVYEMYSTN